MSLRQIQLSFCSILLGFSFLGCNSDTTPKSSDAPSGPSSGKADEGLALSHEDLCQKACNENLDLCIPFGLTEGSDEERQECLESCIEESTHEEAACFASSTTCIGVSKCLSGETDYPKQKAQGCEEACSNIEKHCFSDRDSDAESLLFCAHSCLEEMSDEEIHCATTHDSCEAIEACGEQIVPEDEEEPEDRDSALFIGVSDLCEHYCFSLDDLCDFDVEVDCVDNCRSELLFPSLPDSELRDDMLYCNIISESCGELLDCIDVPSEAVEDSAPAQYPTCVAACAKQIGICQDGDKEELDACTDACLSDFSQGHATCLFETYHCDEFSRCEE